MLSQNEAVWSWAEANKGGAGFRGEKIDLNSRLGGIDASRESHSLLWLTDILSQGALHCGQALLRSQVQHFYTTLALLPRVQARTFLASDRVWRG
jgi:hypothetical protein